MRSLERRTAPLLALLLAGLALPALAQAPAPTAPGPLPFEVRSATLPNGLTVLRVPFNSPGLVAYYTVVRVGSRNEVEKGRTGFAHFFEHMMFRGTPRFPEGARDRLLARLGFNDNAFTSDDITVYTSYGPTSGLEQLVDVEADRFQNLEYSEAAFQTEAKAVLGEYHKSAARPELKLEETLLATAFTRHPYQHTTLGFYEDIQQMPQLYAYSRTFFERWYSPDNTVLVVVGEFDDAALMKWVEEKYGTWQPRKAAVAIPSEPPQRELRQAHVDWKAPTQPRLVLAWHTPAAKADTGDFAVAQLLGDYVAGPTSPLYRELVLEKQLVESIDIDASPHRDPALLTFYITVKQAKDLEQVRLAALGAVNQVARGRVDAKRLEDIQSNAKYGLLMGLETADRVAVTLARAVGVMGRPDALARQVEALARVKPASLSEFVKAHMTARNLTVVTLTSRAQAPSKTEESK